VAEPILNAPRVVTGIGQRVAASVPQHVCVHRKGDEGARPDALDELVDGVSGERAAALGGEDEGRVRALAAQLAQRSHLSPRRGCAEGLPFLARRTCSVAARPNST
jgi:hypothetical protein